MIVHFFKIIDCLYFVHIFLVLWYENATQYTLGCKSFVEMKCTQRIKLTEVSWADLAVATKAQ